MRARMVLGAALLAAALAACTEDGLLNSARGGMKEAGRRQCASDPGKNPVNCLASSGAAR